MSNSNRATYITNAKNSVNRIAKNLYLKCKITLDKKRLMLVGLVICLIVGIGTYFLSFKNKANAIVSEDAMKTFNNLLDNTKGEKINVLSRSELAIKVYNCTKIKGLAADVQLNLYDKGYIRIDTGSSNELNKTKIYIRNDQCGIYIKNDFNIDSIEVGIPTKYDTEQQYDIVILLGKDYKKIGEAQ